jgi:hypothetical protein
MRYLLFHTLDERVPGAFAPSAETLDRVGRFVDEMVRAGVLLCAEGLRPSVDGARVSVRGGRRSILEGPFPGAETVLAGFALVEVKSKDEAIEWASRFAAVIGDVEMEVRKISG